MTCTTHHHACECREAEFARVKAERDQALRDHDEAYGKAWDYKVERDRLRGALREILRYLDSTGQCGDHHITLGEACGMDACVLCLAESVARAALSPYNPGAPGATGSDRHNGPSLTDSSDGARAQGSYSCEGCGRGRDITIHACAFVDCEHGPDPGQPRFTEPGPDEDAPVPSPSACPSCGAKDRRKTLSFRHGDWRDCTDPWHSAPTQGEGG